MKKLEIFSFDRCFSHDSTSASSLDTNRVWPAVEAAGHKPAVGCLTRIDFRTTLPKVMRHALNPERDVFADVEMHFREALKHIYAIPPQHLYG